jgi:hypothetical protein
MIDPLEAVLNLLGRDAELGTLTNDQIAAKHQFAEPGTNGWSTPSTALVLTARPGSAPDYYAGQRRIQIDALCYAATQEQAMAVANRLLTIAAAFVRTTIGTTAGTALIYWLVPDDSPAFDFDSDLAIELVRLPLRACVAADAVIDT